MSKAQPLTDRLYTSIVTASIVDEITKVIHKAYCGNLCCDECYFTESEDYFLNEVLHGNVKKVADVCEHNEGELVGDIEYLINRLNLQIASEGE